MARSSLKSPHGITRYANVFKARARKGKNGEVKGKPKFSILLVFDKKADVSELEEEIERVAVEKWGSKAKQMLASGKLHNPLRDASDYIDDDKEDNYPFDLPKARMARFSKGEDQGQPGVVDGDGEPLMDKADFYDGCMARVSYRAFAFDNESKGVSLALINVQKIDDGKRLSGDPSAEEDFAEKGSKSRSTKKSRRGSDDDDDILG